MAAQRGSEGDLMRFLNNHDIDSETLQALLRSPVGETFCDLWLAYIIDALRSGVPLTAIDPADFQEHVVTGAKTEPIAPVSGLRDEFIEFIYECCFGPVFEIVQLRSTETGYILERKWYSMNPTVSNDESLPAVR